MNSQDISEREGVPPPQNTKGAYKGSNQDSIN